MNVQCGFYCEKGLAFITKFTDEEYDLLPDTVEPKVTVDMDNKLAMIDFGFIKIPLDVLVNNGSIVEFEISFLCYKEYEFYCNKIITCKITKELLIEATGMQKALELMAPQDN